jgi:hypothetical protein
MNSPPPGWLPDTTGRHEYRYWDGIQWSDDVSDAGTTSVDPVAGPEPQASGYGTGHDGGYGGAPGLGSYPSGPYGTPPQKSGPSTGLLVGLGVLLAALVIGIIVIVSSQDDDGTQATSNIDDTTDQSTDTTGATDDTTDTTGDLGDGGSGDASGMTGILADGLVTMSNGVLTTDEATCLADAMIEEIGLGRLAEAGAEISQDGSANPFDVYTEDELSAIADAITTCVPADKIGELGEAFGGLAETSS